MNIVCFCCDNCYREDDHECKKYYRHDRDRVNNFLQSPLGGAALTDEYLITDIIFCEHRENDEQLRTLDGFIMHYFQTPRNYANRCYRVCNKSDTITIAISINKNSSNNNTGITEENKNLYIVLLYNLNKERVVKILKHDELINHIQDKTFLRAHCGLSNSNAIKYVENLIPGFRIIPIHDTIHDCHGTNCRVANSTDGYYIAVQELKTKCAKY